ncbi:MAG: cell surface protein [Verrucomicrobia bacterium]|nr:cell surface protein [Verrucomicrobiota bacterium]
MKIKSHLSVLALSVAVLFLAGCAKAVKNLTPSEFPQNPSNIYILSVEIREKKDLGVVKGSLRPKVVIDGEARMMSASPLGDNIWDYEYKMPSGRRNAVYYFDIEYEVYSARHTKVKSITLPKDGLLKFTLVNRYVVTLESNRGPVGSKIGLVGRGFTPSDQVYVGGRLANSEYFSSNALSFFVPSLPAGSSYNVSVQGESGELVVGSFRVDSAQMQVLPSSVNVASGGRATLIFTIPVEAPMGGLPVEITTNIPDSVILPEVTIPSGSKSVSVPLEGGTPGIGILYVETPGYSPLEVPVQVRN